MNERALQIPSLVQQKVSALGTQGEHWLADLPDVIAHLERQWSITVRQSLTGGSASYVAHARTVDGRDAILKIAIPGLDIAGEARTLASARGRGYVSLLAYDAQQHALLLEALGPSMAQLTLPPELAIEVLCQMLRQAWEVPRPAPNKSPTVSKDSGMLRQAQESPHPVVPTLTPANEKAGQLGRLVSNLWEHLGRPCSERVVMQALRYAERRSAAFDLDRCVVVHGDPHPGNALQVLASRAGAESGFVFVDPDGFLADPAYDLGVVLRDWCQQLLSGNALGLARQYCELLSAWADVDATAIWEWGFLERVSTGLYVLAFGAEDLGRPFLETAEMLV